MATLDFSDCSSLTGWTTETGGGAEGTCVSSGGEIVTTRTTGNSSAPLGFIRTAGQTGATGQVIYWAFRFSGISVGWGNFLGMVRANNTVTHSASAGIYVDDVAGTTKFIVWRGSSTLNSSTTAVAATQYWGKAEIKSDGTVEFSISSTSISGPWTLLSSSIVVESFNATSSTVYFMGCDVWSGTTSVSIDNFYYTSNGVIGASGQIPGTNYSGTGFNFVPGSTGTGSGFSQHPRELANATGYIYTPSISSSGTGFFYQKKPKT